MMTYKFIQTYIIIISITIIVAPVNLGGLFIGLPIFADLEFLFPINSYIISDP